MAHRKFDRPNHPDSLSLNAVTASGPGVAIPVNDSRQVTWLIKGAGTISGGTVIIETADDQHYLGQWNQLDSINATEVSGGKLTGNTWPMPPGNFIRGSIGDPITGGGNISVIFDGLQG